MSRLVDAFLADLDGDALAELARRLAPHLPAAPIAQRDDLLTAKAAAAHADVHPETVRRAIRAGHLATAGHVGRSPRIARHDLDRWLAAGRPSTPSISSRPRTTRRRADRPLAAAVASNSNGGPP